MAFGLLTFHTVTISQRFWKRPILVRHELMSRPQLPFPAITLCNMNAVRRSAWEKYLRTGDLSGIKDRIEFLINSELPEDGSDKERVTTAESTDDEKSRKKRAAGISLNVIDISHDSVKMPRQLYMLTLCTGVQWNLICCLMFCYS